MSNSAQEILYGMALQGLFPGVSNLITSSDEFQSFARRGADLVALVQAADAEVDGIQAAANAKAQAILKEANDHVDAAQKRVRTAYQELAADVRDFFTAHRLEGLLDAARQPAPAVPPVAKPSSVHVLTPQPDPPKAE